ncbi:MAG: hypothetical protein QOJ20_1141 [Mycobacterium sp.]|jgi:hypothetical protein|nr:hypothetical protein [Mycobacterium sp.]
MCCQQSTTRVTLTPRQLKKAQWGPVPASWDHMLHFEAGRALTEQRFALLKSPHIAHIVNVFRAQT